MLDYLLRLVTPTYIYTIILNFQSSDIRRHTVIHTLGMERNILEQIEYLSKL